MSVTKNDNVCIGIVLVQLPVITIKEIAFTEIGKFVDEIMQQRPVSVSKDDFYVVDFQCLVFWQSHPEQNIPIPLNDRHGCDFFKFSNDLPAGCIPSMQDVIDSVGFESFQYFRLKILGSVGYVCISDHPEGGCFKFTRHGTALFLLGGSRSRLGKC